MELSNVNPKLLEEVKYLSTGNLSETVQLLLNNGGSKSFKYASDMMTHCIVGENADTSVIEEVRDIFEKPVVLSNWVPLSIHASKLLPVLSFDPKIPAIFKGVIASVSQVSAVDVKKLWVLLEIHGGKLKPTLDSTCTHLVSTKAFGTKFTEAIKHESITVVTPDWIIQCILEKSLVGTEGYHPSLLVDSKEKSPLRPPVETMRLAKLSLEKKEEVKPRIEEAKPIEVKTVEPKSLSDTPTLAQQLIQPEVINHTTTTMTAPPSTKNMRVASNLPPHLEQQLQQHSMMRNTAPRQQQQGMGAHSGVRMVRSGSGTTWRGASQQQQAVLQRSASNPTSGGDPRSQPQTIQGVRMGSAVHQIRGQANQVTQPGVGSHSQPGHHQTAQQQLPGMVRQVRLVNPNAQPLQQPMQSLNSEQVRPAEHSSQQRGQATNPSSYQQPHQRLSIPQSPQLVKMVIAQPQADGKLPNHPQQSPVASPLINQQQPQFSNIYSQNGQQAQQTGQQPVTDQVIPQQHNFQQVTEDNSNIVTNNANAHLRQQQQTDNSFSPNQVHNNNFAQQHQRGNPRMPVAVNIQGVQVSQQQQTVVRAQGIQRQQLAAPQQPDYSTQMIATGVGTITAGGGSQTQGMVSNQQMGVIPGNQQQQHLVHNTGVRPNVRPTLAGQAVVAGRPPLNTAASPIVQQQQQPHPQQVRQLTPYQQQLLQMHIQNMNPQARQQLQQLSPQVRNVVFQRILQQQEQQQNMNHSQAQLPNPISHMQGQQPNQAPQLQGQQPNQTIQMQVQPAGQRIMLPQQQQGNWQTEQQQNQLVSPQQNVRPYGPIQGLVNQSNQGQGGKPTQVIGVNQQPVDQQSVSPQIHQLQPPVNQVQQQSPLSSVPIQQPNAIQLNQLQQQQLQQQQQQQQLQQPLQQQLQQPLQQQQQLQQPLQQQQNQPQQNQQQQNQQQLQQQLQQQNQEQPSNSVNPKTKTALANLLSTRLQTAPGTPQQPGTPQLSVNPQQVPHQAIAAQQPMILQQAVASQQNPALSQVVMNQQQQQHLLQQRRSLQNITNGVNGTTNPQLAAGAPMVQATNQPQQQLQPKSSMGAVPFTGVRMPGPGTAAVIPGQPVIRREFPVQQQQQQLHSHEPGVKLPEHLCLLGCIVLIVDYQRSVPSAELLQWTKLMSSKGAEIETMYSPRITHLLCETSRSAVAQQALRDGKRLVTAFWLNDVVMKQHMFPPNQVLHFPTPYGEAERPCRNMLVSLSGFEGDDRQRVRFMCEALGLKYTGHFCSQHDVLICRKAEGPKFQKAREWRKPVVTTTWIAQVYFGFLNAIHQIHHPKYQQFNLPAYQQDPLKFELHMAGNFLAAWRIPVKITPESLDKFNKLPAQLRLKRHSTTHSVASNDGDSPSRKKLKIEEEDKEKHERSSSNVDAILEDVIKGGFEEKGKNRVVIRFSGFDSSEVSKAALKLGAGVAHNNREATHLVMPTFMRTPKLLCCLPTVKFILSPRWIHESAQQGKLLDEQPYLLKDTDLERKMDIDLLKLLSLPQRDQLFKGKIFYITPSVVPSRSVLRDIIENSGGQVVAQPKSMKMISELMNKDENSYIVISCATDFHLLNDVMKSKIGIYSSEFVLSAVLKQAIIGAPYRIEP
ncbi:PAX-interacting protein 1-like isoform X2 [Daphnia carinata]|uniref:PAX-interacting protein 1-like isoform X2 n=1 Tax=Daphnia carinata TaxID=120202 RepID=UPI002580733C|nr:PAX-interacting protein 1-like isoform X2 [Daphnia carinata]